MTFFCKSRKEDDEPTSSLTAYYVALFVLYSLESLLFGVDNLHAAPVTDSHGTTLRSKRYA